MVRVKEIIEIYKTKGIPGVKNLLNEEEVLEGTWEEKIKKNLEKGFIESTESEIASLQYLFELNKNG
jgi:hypothetical protein